MISKSIFLLVVVCLTAVSAFTSPLQLMRGNLQRLHSHPPPLTAATLMMSHEEEIRSSGNLFDTVIHSPVFWSSAVMMTVVGLLLVWENVVEYAREKTPKAILPVYENMLVEMGSLGFIGIVISILLNKIALGDTVGRLSEQYLGESDLLMETFEYIHEAFFQVAILFFFFTGTIVVRVLQKLDQVTSIAEKLLGDYSGEDCDGSVAEALADVLGVFTLPPNCSIEYEEDGTIKTEQDCSMLDYEAELVVRSERKQSPFSRELFMTLEERGAETLTIRERLIRELNLPRTFRIDQYLESVFAGNKMKIVDLSPLLWLPLIPAIALANALDLTHDVLNADAANAAESSGFFFSTSWVLEPSLALQVVCLAWGILNFWKMAEIKSMLMPTLVRDAGNNGEIRLLPPPIENDLLRIEFDSTPPLLKPLERVLGKEPGNVNLELFGDVGGNGPKVYLDSIKYHTWFCVASVHFFFYHILSRDLYAVLHPDTVGVGDPQHLLPEILTYGGLILIAILQLYVAPTTFLNYCIITSVEDLKMNWAIEQSIDGWDGKPMNPSGREA